MSDFTTHTADFWNERYQQDAFIYGTAPNAYLAAQKHRLRSGMRAFVPGDGEGRNGVWLAGQGLDVLAVDLSHAGVRKAQALADARGVSIQAERADLAAWDWPEAAFDLIVAIYFHLGSDLRPRLHAKMAAALRPGGLLILEAFRPEQLQYRERYGSVGGPPMEDLLFTADMLRDDFARLSVIELDETETELHEGEHHTGRSAVVRGIFQRPDSE